jgi:hypothetical protein
VVFALVVLLGGGPLERSVRRAMRKPAPDTESD